MNPTIKVILALMTVTCCHCAPSYRREENIENPTAVINNQETLPDTQVVPEEASEGIIIDEPLTNDKQTAKEIQKIAHPTKFKKQAHNIDNSAEEGRKSFSTQLAVLSGRPLTRKEFYDDEMVRKVITQYFSSLMSSVLSANLTDVAIEKTNEDDKTKETKRKQK